MRTIDIVIVGIGCAVLAACAIQPGPQQQARAPLLTAIPPPPDYKNVRYENRNVHLNPRDASCMANSGHIKVHNEMSTSLGNGGVRRIIKCVGG